MVEEAIRNGTWIPPSPGGSGPFGWGRTKVDLSKKPKMWETYVADSEKDATRLGAQQQPPHAVTEWDWESIRPFSTSYLPPPAGAPLPLRLPSAGMVGFPPRLSYYRRVIRFLRPNLHSSAPFPLNERRMSDVNLDASAPIDWTGNPKKLQVAVIVAMPRPPTEHAPTDGTAHPLDEEHEIPHVEFGIAQLDVKLPDDDGVGVVDARSAKVESRASGSGSMDV